MIRTITILAAFTAFLLLCSIACGETVKPDDKQDLTGLVDNEKVINQLNATYDGTDLELNLGAGISFSVTKSANLNSEKKEISISIIGEERYFNTENDIVFDFSKMKHQMNFDFAYTLPKNLVKEDISLFIYAPETSEEKLDAKEINFTYDLNTGILRASFAAPSDNPIINTAKNDSPEFQSGSGKYSRLTLSWTDRQTLAERPQERIITMPYYEQPEGTCWATCAAMLARAYAQINDPKANVTIISFLKNLGHNSLNDGMGLWAFRRSLPNALANKVGMKFETSTFVSSANLLNQIIAKLNDNIPVILNLDYPGVGGHAVLVTGYRIELVSIARITVKLQYHNPQNLANESMYRWADFDWLMAEKSLTEAYQILYADRAVPNNRPLVTVAMPLKNLSGEFAAIVPIKRQDGSIRDFKVQMSYKRDAPNAYEWIYNLGDVVVTAFPDSADRLSLKLPIFNSAQVSKTIHVELKAYNIDKGALLYENSQMKTFAPGTNTFESSISLNEFVAPDAQTHVLFNVDLWEGGNYLDGYSVRFKVEPKMEIEFTCNVGIMGESKVICPDKTTISEGQIYFGSPKIKLAGQGKKFQGTLQENTTNYKITRNITIEFDKEINPTTITFLKIELINEIYFDSALHGTQHNVAELRNIPITPNDKVGTQIMINIHGSDVCKFITKTSYDFEPAQSGACAVELTKHWCTEASSMYINIK